MKIKNIYLLSFFQTGLLFLIPSLGNFFTLGDRERYVTFQSVDIANNLTRTTLTDLIFNFGGIWLEFGLATLSIFLHFYLVNNFANTLKVNRFNKIISILWLLLPAHFILRSIAGKELLASLSFCILILFLYPYLFSNLTVGKSFPGNFLRKDKKIMIICLFFFSALLLFLRPFFLLIFLLLFIPYFYKKIPFKKESKKFLFISLFIGAIVVFLYIASNNYELVQKYISTNFVGRRDSTFTNIFIPNFDSFSNYLLFLFNNIFDSLTGPLQILLNTSVGPILLIEGLIVIIPLILILFRNIIRFIFKPKFRLSKGLTDLSIFVLFLLIYSILGYVNFLAGWRLQSGSWILFILLYLKISKI